LCLESPIADSWGKTRCGSRGGVLSGCEPCPFCGGANDVLTARSAALVSCCTGRTANLFTVLCIRVVQGPKREVEAWKSWASCRSIRIILRRDTCLLFAAMCCHASSLLNELHPNLPRLFYEEHRNAPAICYTCIIQHSARLRFNPLTPQHRCHQNLRTHRWSPQPSSRSAWLTVGHDYP
jgi:hypothetical protein